MVGKEYQTPARQTRIQSASFFPTRLVGQGAAGQRKPYLVTTHLPLDKPKGRKSGARHETGARVYLRTIPSGQKSLQVMTNRLPVSLSLGLLGGPYSC